MRPHDVLTDWTGCMITVVIAGQSLSGNLIGFDDATLVLNDSAGGDLLINRSATDFMFLGEGVD